MNHLFENSFLSLKSYCESQNFAGWDPYDGLNSKVFQATFLKHWDLARLAWIQGFKRSPANFRKLMMVPKGHNPKGIALFLTGYCNIYKAQQKSGEELFGSQQEIIEKISFLANLLLSLQSKGYSGACWGYNFDWQARGGLFFPEYTPTVVVTSFCVSALLSAYKIINNKILYNTALSSAHFILNDLSKTFANGGYILSYSPLSGNNTVYNASLLGAKTLSLCYKYTGNNTYKEEAFRIINAACNGQAKDGSWIYGLGPTQSWIDSFHTGYNLEALRVYQNLTGDESFKLNLKKGFQFYIRNFFLDDGTPKYYHNRTWPVDIHCPAQLFVTLHMLNKFYDNRILAERVMKWTIENMQDKKGCFYYQLKKIFSSKISYMRWSNAFMFYAMSYYLLKNDNELCF